MALKRKISLSIEQVQQQEESENSPTTFILTPTGTKHFRRQFSEQNFGKFIEKHPL